MSKFVNHVLKTVKLKLSSSIQQVIPAFVEFLLTKFVSVLCCGEDFSIEFYFSIVLKTVTNL